jgi:hypothetical protein
MACIVKPVSTSMPPRRPSTTSFPISRAWEEWSPENIGGEWQGGGSGKVGDRYIGHNRTAERAWSVPVMVTVAERGRCFEFVTRPDEGPYVRWTYRLEPSGTGTRVTEIWDVEQLPPAMQSATQEQLRRGRATPKIC